MVMIDNHECFHLLTDMPRKEVEELVDHLLGVKVLEPCCVADRAVGVLRYVVGVIFKGHCPTPVQSVSHMDNAAKASELKKLLAVHADGTAPYGINWGLIVSLVLQIIQEIVGG